MYRNREVSVQICIETLGSAGSWLGLVTHGIRDSIHTGSGILYIIFFNCNIASPWGGVSGVALKGNPDTGFVYKAQPSAHDAQLALFPVALGQPSSPFLQLGRPSSLWLTVAHFSSPQLGPARPSCLSSVQLAPARSSYPDTAHIPSSSGRYGRKRAV